MTERFAELRALGIKTVMITGDNPLTARAIAAEAGVDDYLAEATPEDKMARIRAEQAGGKLVAMTGDGTNDAPALALADVGVAMNSGTQAAKEAGNMVDLDSDPTKLIDVVEIGKQLLITRGALTTFSIANDVAKYFAILPAMFVARYPDLDTLNVMRLGSASSAILSAVIFNALIIVGLIPVALRGVRFRAGGAAEILRRNLLVYGVGGLIAPFVGIKLIDIVITALGVNCHASPAPPRPADAARPHRRVRHHLPTDHDRHRPAGLPATRPTARSSRSTGRSSGPSCSARSSPAPSGSTPVPPQPEPAHRARWWRRRTRTATRSSEPTVGRWSPRPTWTTWPTTRRARPTSDRPTPTSSRPSPSGPTPTAPRTVCPPTPRCPSTP